MKIFELLAAILIVPNLIWADCAPEKMIKIVHRDITPGVNSSSFAAKPRTLYRLGTKYLRLEEEPDQENGIHALLITNEPDSWMVNLMTGRGRHIVDGGPTFVARAPILWSEDLRQLFREFEYGCEVDFAKRRSGTPPGTRVVDGEKLKYYQVSSGPYLVVLYVTQNDQKPRRVVLQKGPEVIHAIQYDTYETQVSPEIDLFQKPRGIEYEVTGGS